jgi:hypothetical protein
MIKAYILNYIYKKLHFYSMSKPIMIRKPYTPRMKSYYSPNSSFASRYSGSNNTSFTPHGRGLIKYRTRYSVKSEAIAQNETNARDKLFAWMSDENMLFGRIIGLRLKSFAKERQMMVSFTFTNTSSKALFYVCYNLGENGN